MLKLVWCDYRGQAWSALKNVCNSGGWFFYVYMGILWPLIYSDNTYEVQINYSVIGPMIFGMLLSRMYPNRINKTLLLCPMSVEDRKKYLVTGYKLRVAITLLLFLICNVPLLIMKKIMFTYLVVMFLFQFLLTVSLNIYCIPAPNAKGAFEREDEIPGYSSVWDAALLLSGIFGMFVLANIQMAQKDFFEDKIKLVVAAILMLVELGLCIKTVYTYYKPVMEQAVCYDTSYGKEKRNEINR